MSTCVSDSSTSASSLCVGSGVLLGDEAACCVEAIAVSCTLVCHRESVSGERAARPPNAAQPFTPTACS
eukprot:243144-Prymnesium_polylepis.1